MDLVSVLKKELKHIGKIKITKKKIPEQIFIRVNKDNLIKTLKILKNNENTQYWQLTELTAIDYPDSVVRFDVIYVLLSHKFNNRIVVKSSFKDGEKVPSATELYPSANWQEREVYDMFGIEFENHPNMTRILNEDDFKEYPLRKEFPKQGRKELFYDEQKEEFVYKDITYVGCDEFIMDDFCKKEGK